jgi:nuclear protein localization family protein 4
MLIRIRSRDGLERVKVDRPNATVGELKSLIQSQLQVPIPSQILSTNQKLLLAKGNNAQQFKDMEDPNMLLSSLGIGHGHIVFLSYEGERSIAGPQINVSPSGSFGKKMTMDELIARQVRIERQDKPHCGSASFDRDAANAFQQYVNENLAFAIKRGGFMYGTVTEGGEVAVDFIYEPPQQGTEDSLLLFRDPDEEKQVEAIAIGLGMRRVGFIFTQTITQGKKDYTLSNAEIRQAAELHAESELKEWVTALVKLEVNEEGGADVHFEAFQLSDQCVKLFKEGWFVDNCADLDLKITRMKKDVVILGKDTRDVDNDFFLVLVKILDHQGPLSSTFPIENRDPPVTLRALKNHLDRTKNFSYVKRISDFHLLLLLAKYLDVNADVPQLAACVQAQVSIPEGYQMIIDSLASS